MESRTVLLIAVPILFALALLLVVTTTLSRQRAPTGSLGRGARRADRSGFGDDARRRDPDQAARARFDEAKASLEPAGAASAALGGLVRVGGSSSTGGSWPLRAWR